jgi:O-antigen ligase
VYFEKIFEKDIIGFSSSDAQRIASFFNKELIVGSFLFAFSFLAFSIFHKKNQYLYWLLILLLGLAIFLSGERAIFFKYLFYIFIFFFLLERRFFFLTKIIITLGFILLLVFSLKISNTTKDRQSILFDTLLSDRQNNYNFTSENIKNNLYKIKHFAHYYTAWKIFEDHPFFGAGLKTYRIACANPNYFNEKIIQSEVRCTTHPHQIHFEILSELGLTGYLMFLLFFFYFLYMAIKQYIKNKDILLLNSTLYIFVALIPIIPSGSFFGTISGVFFYTNIGVVLSFLIKKNKNIKLNYFLNFFLKKNKHYNK